MAEAKLGKETIEYQMFADLWSFLQKNCDVDLIDNDKYWRKAIDEANTIGKKWEKICNNDYRSEYCNAILVSTMELFEQKQKMLESLRNEVKEEAIKEDVIKVEIQKEAETDSEPAAYRKAVKQKNHGETWKGRKLLRCQK